MSRLQSSSADARSANPAGRDFSEALARGLGVLGTFSSDSRAMTLSEIARKLDLPRATVRRALLTLVHMGYLAEEGRLFRIQPKILELASSYLDTNPISSILQPLCERLATELDANCSVAVMDQTEALMIAYASPRKSPTYQIRENIGMRLPAYCSAVGRILISALPPDERDTFLQNLSPVRLTPFTVTDKQRLSEIFSHTAETGFCIVEQEVEIGYCSIAVPLIRRDGVQVAALNMGTRVEKISSPEKKESIIPVLHQACSEIRNQLL
ncbi:helix-turn-helix domain-containing protein [Komagataeibacter oboediens]|uniref:IclR family transcriptional regulator domain-containing protein n=1 Tax=Komagataeibacter oboediens TaxID=65958 RepID=UPI001C2C3D82|nr:IclR family transcriptional regulator C-terminal domain-containing protein [Komagataeibacter oboediens]MBV0888334.1 helix-turn-helix domain-containing protein [Komagataeibacter oboediens]MCK9820329.1 helix-turn-helix domain-containing protein [Komagataeibacter oboediens]